jgi:hypothetical protein
MQKLSLMKKVVQERTLNDIRTIKRLTGVKDIRYEDLVFLRKLVS